MRVFTWQCVACGYEFKGRGVKCPECGGLVKRRFGLDRRFKQCLIYRVPRYTKYEY